MKIPRRIDLVVIIKIFMDKTNGLTYNFTY